MSDNTKKRLFDHKFDIVAFILIAGIFIYFMMNLCKNFTKVQEFGLKFIKHLKKFLAKKYSNYILIKNTLLNKSVF